MRLTDLLEEVAQKVADAKVSEAYEEAEALGLAPSDDSEIMTTRASSGSAEGTSSKTASEAFRFLSEQQIREEVRARVGKPPREALLVFRTRTQRTWFVAVEGMIVCLLDDERTRASNRLVQWKEPVGPLTDVEIETKPGSDWLGHARVGRRQRWLVNLRLFAEGAAQATAKLEDLRAAARS